ncbi:MAG TPA: AMP-binding protein [Kofleriaceae bacterium]|nr:AMP-binding protein [Kofleriaceae bacterium]
MNHHSLAGWIARRAAVSGKRTALIYQDRRTTYAELHGRVLRLAHALRELGVRPGDRIGFLGPNHPGHLESLFASGTLGAISVLLHFRFSASELVHAINEARCEVVLFTPESAAIVEEIRPALCVRHYVATDRPPASAPAAGFALDYEELLARAPATPIDRAVDPHDVAIIAYTSGTTGANKGVVLSHGNLVYNVFNFLSCSDYVSDDIMLTAAPLYRMGGLGTLLPVFFKGAAVVLLADFHAERTFDLVERHRVTILFNGPNQFAQLAASPRFKDADLSSVRFCMCGGDVVPAYLIATYLERSVTFQQGYGLTEAAPLVLLLDKADVLDRAGSAGQPPLFVETRVVREDLADVAPGEIGELVVRGPNVMSGYWEHPEWTAQAFAGEWLRTGDAARRDGDGFIYIVDRVKDAMVLAGQRVYPAEIERVVTGHPAVADCAVIAHDGAPIAFVVARPASAVVPAELVLHCRRQLAAHLVPAQIHVIAELPRNINGKLMRRTLRELAAAPASSTGR